MAEIALRSYIKEIDESIEQEQLDQAIAHCRHILETYPKHLDTYRLLGKAYLEAKRYGDAADLFQRVLSAVPDDFVAHVGMSIVREDEGNLDASIWHMERAFETNPANATIQQELRRLIGRRDGLEPHKVRLTRGALARMYTHGELYQQAVAELRSALTEDPERPDLQVLLANLYWRMNQRQEAIGVSKAIVDKLPFCRDANRILAASLQGADKIEEAAAYHRRLAALDPYAAFVESAMVDPTTVDPASVRLEKLTWSPGQSLTPLPQGRPGWATSLGEELKSQKPAAPPVNLPSWLESKPSPEPVVIPAPRAPSEPIHPFAGAKPPTEAPIPQWMEEAGWHPSKGEAVEGPVDFSESELEGRAEAEGVQPAVPLAAAEMPGWMSEISPPSEPAPREPEQGSGLPEWMKDIQAMAGPAVAAAGVAAAKREREESASEAEAVEATTPSAADTIESAELPTWLDEVAPGASETIVYWLGDRDKSSGAEPPPDLQAPGVPEGAPDWLQEAAAEAGDFGLAAKTSEGVAPAELPGWLDGVASAAAQEPEPAGSGGFPAWMDEPVTTPLEPEFEAEPEVGASTPAEEAPDWLRSILGTEAEAEPTAQPSGEAAGEAWAAGAADSWIEPEGEAVPAEEAPDWLARLTSPGEQTGEEATGAGALEAEAVTTGSPVASAAAAAASVDWLRGMLGSSDEEEAAQPEAEAEPEAWLRGLEGEAPQQPEPVTELPAPDVGSDDWLRSMVSEPSEGAVEPPSFELEEPEWLERLVAPDSDAAPGVPAEAPDWVKALAAMEPGGAAEAPAPPEEPPAPEWLGRGVGGEPEPTAQAIAPEEEAVAPEAPPWMAQPAEPGAAPRPQVMMGLAAQESDFPIQRGVGAPPAAPAPDTPDWLREFADAAADETPAPTTRSPAPAPPPPDLEYEGALDWLREGETGPIGAEEAELGAAGFASVASTPAGDVDDSEIFRWLEDLAQRQSDDGVPSGIVPRVALPAQEAAPPVQAQMPIPEDADASMEWLDQLAGVQAPISAETEAESLRPSPAAPAEVPVARAPIEEVTAVEPIPPTPRQPERPAPPPPEPEDEDITLWLKSLSMAEPQPAPSEEPSQVAAEPQALPERPPKKPTWTPVDEAWLEPAAPSEPQPEPAAPSEAAAPPVGRKPAAKPRPTSEAAAPEPAAAGRPKSKALSPAETLARARQNLSHGDFEKASKDYSTVIKKKYELDTVITELRMAAEHFPGEAGLWQLLGDAYMRAEQLDEAVEAYNRGMQAV